MAKQPNYSAELVAQITADYEAGKSVQEIADEVGKTARSVISKLVREGVYKAPEKPKAAKREEGPTKGEMLTELDGLVNFSVDGLAGANKEAIANVIVLAKSAQVSAE